MTFLNKTQRLIITLPNAFFTVKIILIIDFKVTHMPASNNMILNQLNQRCFPHYVFVFDVNYSYRLQKSYYHPYSSF